MHQPDIRMKYKRMGAEGKAHFDRAWAQPDDVIIFLVYQGLSFCISACLHVCVSY